MNVPGFNLSENYNPFSENRLLDDATRPPGATIRDCEALIFAKFTSPSEKIHARWAPQRHEGCLCDGLGRQSFRKLHPLSQALLEILDFGVDLSRDAIFQHRSKMLGEAIATRAISENLITCSEPCQKIFIWGWTFKGMAFSNIGPKC